MSTMPDSKILLHVAQIGNEMVALHDGEYTLAQRLLNPVAADKTTPPVPTWTDNGVSWAFWGDNDLLPTTMRQKMEAVPIAGATLEKKTSMMIGEDLIWVKTEDYRRFGLAAEQVYVPEVEDFMEANRIETEWWPAQCADYSLHYNSFSEFALSRDRSKITGLYHIAAEHGRLSKANARNQVDWLLYSMHFPFGTAQNDASRVPIPLYKWYDRESFLAGLRNWRFAWHTRFPTPGMIYYARPWWIGLFKDNGWMDVSAAVPRIVSAMQRNQMTLKYVIAIPESYFIIMHPEWMGYTNEKRQEIIDTKVKELNTYLSGVENVYKSISFVFRQHEVTGVAMGKIEITPIDDKAKQGVWVPDSYAADAQIVQGFGIHPTNMGLTSNSGSMGAGSGSDKMQTYNQGILLNTKDQRLALEPLNYASVYNNWGLTCVVKHTTLTTQDNNRQGVEVDNPKSNNLNNTAPSV